MAHREFRDIDGRVWDVWDVHPLPIERRMLEDRRAADRAGTDRRQRPGQRLLVPAPLEQGWLAFRAADERRRLAPIPEGWETLPPEDLAALARTAVKLGSPRRPIE